MTEIHRFRKSFVTADDTLKIVEFNLPKTAYVQKVIVEYFGHGDTTGDQVIIAVSDQYPGAITYPTNNGIIAYRRRMFIFETTGNHYCVVDHHEIIDLYNFSVEPSKGRLWVSWHADVANKVGVTVLYTMQPIELR